jgi:alpha-galactosidase
LRTSTRIKTSSPGIPDLPPRSIEYGSYIIEAMETGKVFRLNGNIVNGNMIGNLPPDCCGEGPVYVDRLGLHKTIVGKLPSQCAALNMTNVNVQRGNWKAMSKRSSWPARWIR